MKRILFTFLAFWTVLGAGAQTQLLLVGQTFGEMEMYDTQQLFTFGYTADYGQDLTIPGPTLHMIEGDSVIIDFHNLSMANHTVHLHGLDVDQENDGVPQLSYAVPMMEHGYYHFRAPHPGTYIYHCHVVSSVHVQAGMYGLIIVEPAGLPNMTWEGGYAFDYDLNFMTFEFDMSWHTVDFLSQPMNSVVTLPEYHPQYFMINGFSEQQLAENNVEIVAAPGEVSLVRLANIGYYANRVVFPEGLDVLLIASDGRPVPDAINTSEVWVFPGERYDVLVQSSTPISDVVDFEYINMNNGLVENTQHIDVVIETPENLMEVELLDGLLFPNPARDEIHLNIAGLGDVNAYQIVDVAGALCASERVVWKDGVQTINIEDLRPGVYALTLIAGSKSMSTRFVVED